MSRRVASVEADFLAARIFFRRSSASFARMATSPAVCRLGVRDYSRLPIRRKKLHYAPGWEADLGWRLHLFECSGASA